MTKSTWISMNTSYRFLIKELNRLGEHKVFVVTGSVMSDSQGKTYRYIYNLEHRDMCLNVSFPEKETLHCLFLPVYFNTETRKKVFNPSKEDESNQVLFYQVSGDISIYNKGEQGYSYEHHMCFVVSSFLYYSIARNAMRGDKNAK